MNEEWRVLPSNQIYEVSSLGRVRSVDRLTAGGRRTGRVLKVTVRKTGKNYRYVSLWDGQQHRNAKIAHLVLEAFVGPRPLGEDGKNLWVRHLNDDSMDDRAANLAWGTASENALDRFRNGGENPKGEKHGNAKLGDREIRLIRFAVLELGQKQNAVAKRYGVSTSTVHDIVSGRGWGHI